MGCEFSTYLNLLRLGAALAVFLGHAAWLWMPGHLRPFLAHGRTVPVLVFFVLSGFVIAFVTDGRERTGADYAVNRAARLYSVALPALLATFALDALGRHLAPALYGAEWGYSRAHPLRQFARALLFLNEIWGWRSCPGSDAPFWSLAYEAWYYVAFGLLAFGGRWRLLAAAALAFAGPMVAALFPVWLLGVGCYRLGRRGCIGAGTGCLLAVGGLGLTVLVEWAATRAGLRSPPAPLFAHRGELVVDYAIAIGVAAHLLGMRVVEPLLAPLLRPAARPVAWAAGATFTLYLFHFPVAQCLAALSPWAPGSLPSMVLILLGTIAVILAIAEVTERRKGPWRGLFAALLGLASKHLPSKHRFV